MLACHYIYIVNTGRGLRTLNMYTKFPAASFPINNYLALISHRHSSVLDLLWSHKVTSMNRPKKNFTETAQDSFEIVMYFNISKAEYVISKFYISV